ncbi:lipoyl(octanoyl) transferase LipB [Falsarthrobacter nasiphocae]|uniref:Octanoyltransferase n=1 Tax=Falsarthrobacter nasiphocae TaxID=189863 RepID=A0AAE3YFM6_9MICC|nr:lipoyl(octanoyl) transferase LipB [Falsarthrobacter nasiphocae]MDR6891289.1 lipoyl(octanoyl) transferase [Falsarthrobacter nasiphocae]
MAVSLRRIGLDPEFVDYVEAWDLQKSVHADVLAGHLPSTVLLLEHAPVYTAGRRTEDHERPVDGSTPVVDVDRGGKLTWHGPGQLTVYPILRLPDPSKVREYVWNIEQLIIDVLERYGVRGQRIDGWEGVWLPADDARPPRKIAAIGMRVKEGVSMHGFALNVSNSLDPYSRIIPCGITTAGVTSLEAETGQSLTPEQVAATVEEMFSARAALFDAETSAPQPDDSPAEGSPKGNTP